MTSLRHSLLLCVLQLNQAHPRLPWAIQGKDENQTHPAAMPTALTHLASKPGTLSFTVPQSVSMTIVQSNLSAQETSSH